MKRVLKVLAVLAASFIIVVVAFNLTATGLGPPVMLVISVAVVAIIAASRIGSLHQRTAENTFAESDARGAPGSGAHDLIGSPASIIHRQRSKGRRMELTRTVGRCTPVVAI